jgi:hypothetical protein
VSRCHISSSSQAESFSNFSHPPQLVRWAGWLYAVRLFPVDSVVLQNPKLSWALSFLSIVIWSRSDLWRHRADLRKGQWAGRRHANADHPRSLVAIQSTMCSADHRVGWLDPWLAVFVRPPRGRAEGRSSLMLRKLRKRRATPDATSSPGYSLKMHILYWQLNESYMPIWIHV